MFGWSALCRFPFLARLVCQEGRAVCGLYACWDTIWNGVYVYFYIAIVRLNASGYTS